MIKDNSNHFDIFNMSEVEMAAVSEFTDRCVMLVKYCQEEFDLDTRKAHIVAGSAVNHFFNLIKLNPELKQTIQGKAEYMKHKREELSKQPDKNPSDDAG